MMILDWNRRKSKSDIRKRFW